MLEIQWQREMLYPFCTLIKAVKIPVGKTRLTFQYWVNENGSKST